MCRLMAMFLLVILLLFTLNVAEVSANSTRSASMPNGQLDIEHVALADGVDITGDAQSAHSVRTADLDRDGDLDVLTASRLDGQVRWHRNENGATGFTPFSIDIVGGAYIAIPGDVDGDGDEDVIVAAVSEVRPAILAPADSEAQLDQLGAILWYRNDGMPVPTFTRHIVFSAINYPVSVHGADLDGDGDLDLLSASRDDNRVIWYENDGNRNEPTFTPYTLTDSASGAVSVSSADFDNDGDLDVVSASENDDQIAWYENVGSQPLQFITHVIRHTTGAVPLEFDYAKSVFGADVDGDGDQDIVYGSEEDGLLGWYENDGGAPPQFYQHTVATGADHAKFVTAEDMDRDGDVDLFIASSGDNTVAWYENDGEAVPSFQRRVVTDQAMGARYVHVADLEGDGDMDVLTASRSDNRITWYQNQTIHRSAAFPPLAFHPVSAPAGAQVAQAGDLDGDGAEDLVSIGHSALAWHRNDGGESPTFVDNVIDAGFTGGRWADLSDLDSDGDLDIVFVSVDGGTIGWYESDGANAPLFLSRTIDVNAGGVVETSAVDLDMDGDLDLIAASPGINRVVWYENMGETPPSFSRHVVSDSIAGARRVVAADLNGDGRLDLVPAPSGSDALDWYENQGDTPLTFVGRRVADIVGGVQHIHAADLDNDGRTDLLTTSEANANIVWHQNSGGTPNQFQSHVVGENISAVHALSIQDLDQDGDLDIAAVVDGEGVLVWYENDGQTLPTFTRRAVDGITASHTITADLDGDGDHDLLAVAANSGAVHWIENMGGQYGVAASAVPTRLFSDSQPNELSSYAVAHRGKPGDDAIDLGKIEMAFRDSTGQALSTGQIQQCISALYIYRSVCRNQRYEPSEDQLAATVSPVVLDPNGRLTLDLPVGVPEVRVWPWDEALFFVAGDFQESCDLRPHEIDVSFVLNQETARASAMGTLLSAEAYGPNDHVMPQTVASAPALFINEVGHGGASQLEAGWIEIFNAELADVDLGGMYLTNDPTDPTRYHIPDDVWIPARGYLVFVADGNPHLGPTHANFNLSDGPSTLTLSNSAAWEQALIDNITIDALPSNSSSGRFPDGSSNWIDLSPTPETYNHVGELPFKEFLPINASEIGCR